MKQFGFPREQKLKHKKDIDLLFQKGKWSTCGNLRVITLDLSKYGDLENKDFKIGVSVSKKFFKKAVDRNRIKRLLKEAYRHHKADCKLVFGPQSLTMLFWVSKVAPENFGLVESELLTYLNSKK